MHDEKPDRFVDDLLEASLKHYHGEEPRQGLEKRILAGVRTRERAGLRRSVVWVLAACAGILTAIALTLHVALGPRRQPIPRASLPPKESGVERTPLEAATPPAQGMASRQEPRLRPGRPSSAGARDRGPRLVPGAMEKPRTAQPAVRATRHARPEQFPTPLPITEEEKLLLAYVSKAGKAEVAEKASTADEAPISELSIPAIQIAPLDIKPLDDSQSEPGK